MSVKPKRVRQRRSRKPPRKASSNTAIVVASQKKLIAAQEKRLSEQTGLIHLYELGNVKPQTGQMLTILSGDIAVNAQAEQLEAAVDIERLYRDVGKAVLDSGAVYFAVGGTTGVLNWRCNAQLIPGGLDSWRQALKTIYTARPWEH